MEGKPILQTLYGLKRNNPIHGIAATTLRSAKSGGAFPHHSASARQLQPSGGSLHPLHKPGIKPKAGRLERLVLSSSGSSGLVSTVDRGGQAMTSKNASAEGRQMLEALQQSVTKALDQEHRLGHYTVTWHNCRPVVAGDAAPHQQPPAPGR
jgi:hypothetical protein